MAIRLGFKIALGAVVAIVAVLVVVAGSDGAFDSKRSTPAKRTAAIAPTTPVDTRAAAAPAQPATPIEVAAIKLFADYEANEVSADDKYKGATLLVTGVIANIGKDVLGDPYVRLDTGNPVFGVQCMFDDSSGLAALKKRQRITMRCKNTGKMGNVILRNCVVAPAAPVPATPSKQRAKTEAATPENRERFAHDLSAKIGDKGSAVVQGLMLVLSTAASEERTCASLKDAVFEGYADRLIGLGFTQVKCEGDSIISGVR